MSQPNWLGLLKWSLAQQDGTTTSQFSQMSEVDKAWLERVMKEAVKDEPQRINEIMQYMKELLSRGDKSIPESEQEKIEIQLEELRDIIEQIDMAQVLTKFGGCEILLSLLTFTPLSNDSKAVAAAAIGTATQNNITTQDILYQKHFLSSLVPIFLQSKTTLVKNKLLYAISCMIRGHASAEEFFVLHYLQPVAEHIFTSSSAVQTLVARFFFLLDALITSDYSSTSRIEHIATLLLPRLLTYLNAPASPDAQENAMNIFISLTHTEYGWSQVTSSTEYLAQAHQALQKREQTIRQNGKLGAAQEEDYEEMSKEEKIAALKQVIQVRVNLEKLTVQYPVATTTQQHIAALSETGSTATTTNATNNDENSTGTVFLIEPPSLAASSPIP